MKDLWKGGTHLIESGRVIVANNFINYLNNFLRPVNHTYRVRYRVRFFKENP